MRALRWLHDRLPQPVKDGILQGFVQGVVLFTILWLAVILLGSQAQEQQLLQEISNGTKAQVCVLSLPVDDAGRDETAVQACLIDNGIEP